jgi:uncharacterized protein GlcG (DUF336 family)
MTEDPLHLGSTILNAMFDEPPSALPPAATHRISLAQANAIVTAALAKGRSLGLNPLGVAVVDAGGHMVSFQREDGAPSLRLQVALAKASGAVALSLSSRRLADLAVERPAFVAALGGLAPNGLVPSAGGVIVQDGEGHAIGAVGVSGDLPDNDELCALAGIAEAGMRAQT